MGRRVRRASRLVGVTLLGSVLLVAGLVMLITPGPGLVAIAAGLAVLAREFTWARRLLERVRVRLVSRRFRREPRTAATDLRAAQRHPDVTPLPHAERHVA